MNLVTATIKRVILFFVFLVCGTVLYAAPIIPGKWQGKLNDAVNIALNLIMDGTKLSGIVYTPWGEYPVLGAKVKGDEFSFSIDPNNMQAVYKGKVTGDKMILTLPDQYNGLSGELTRLDPKAAIKTAVKAEFTEFWEPVPRVVTPAPGAAATAAPSDAIVLFDGKNLDSWQGAEGGSAKWDVSDNVFTVKKGTGDIQTKQVFGDYQLHIEWMVPADIQGEGQSRGNSGVFMQGIYELQVLDSYNNKTYVNGQAGSIYKQTPPLVNAMRKPGEWNVYDIIYTAPRFSEKGTLDYPARITVVHNGIVIQNNTEIRGTTPYTGLPKYTAHGKGPIRLQDHGDPSKPISFRNIWIREL